MLSRRDMKQLSAILAVQAVTYALPLVLVPFLGRTLGRDGFGRLAVAQSFGTYITVIIQYGFNYSGTRAVAKVLDDAAALAISVRDITGAKLALTFACFLLCCCLEFLRVDFSLGGMLFWSAFAWGVVNGFSLLWFFQGSHRLEMYAYIDCVGRIVALGLILTLVRRPTDDYLVLLLQCGGAGASLIPQFTMMYSRVSFRLPRPLPSVSTLARDFHVFASRCVESVYLSGTSLILGMVQPAGEVGLFAGPEKIVRAVAYGVFPYYQVAYPRLVAELGRDRKHALRYARFTILTATGAAAVFAAILWVGAGPIVRVALGPQFKESIPILRLMAPLTILMVLTGGVGSNLMLALDRDKYLTRILAIGGSFCAIATWGLSLKFGATGSCLSLLLTYALINVFIWRHFKKWKASEAKCAN
jgi:PST family polysaccharide transporter